MTTDGHTETLTTNTDTAEVDIVGRLHLHLSGTFGGSTLTLKMKDSNGTYRDVAGGALTVASDKVFDFPARARNTVKVTMTNQSSSTVIVSFQAETR